MIFILIVFLFISALTFAVLMNMRKANPFEQGKLAFHAQEYVNAIELLQKVLTSEPFHPHAHYYLAESYRHLNLFPEALKHLKEIYNIEIYDSLIKKEDVYHKIADYQQMLSLHDEALQTNLEILHANPQDEKANHRLLFMALGEKRFDIAEIYAQKIATFENQSKEIQKALAVTFFYSHKADVAFNLIEKLLQEYPHDIDLQLTYIAMCRDTHYPQGMEKILTLLKQIEDNGKKRNLIYFFLHMAIRQEHFSEAVSFLEQRVSNPDYPDALRERMYFFYVLFLLKISNFHKAEKALQDLKDFTQNTNAVQSLLPFIKEKSLTIIHHPDEKSVSVSTSYLPKENEREEEKNNIKEQFSVQKFDPIYEESIENLFPPDFLYQVSNYAGNFQINFEKYFSSTPEGGTSMRKIFADPKEKSKANMLMRYGSLNTESLFRFARVAVIELGYKNNGKELTSPEKDGVDIITQKQYEKGNANYLISFRRFPPNSKISDIYLNAYIRQAQNAQVSKAVLIANAMFTEAAQEKLKGINFIEVIGQAKLLELLQAALKD